MGFFSFREFKNFFFGTRRSRPHLSYSAATRLAELYHWKNASGDVLSAKDVPHSDICSAFANDLNFLVFFAFFFFMSFFFSLPFFFFFFFLNTSQVSLNP